jgi:hypothetical protein
VIAGMVRELPIPNQPPTHPDPLEEAPVDDTHEDRYP